MSTSFDADIRSLLDKRGPFVSLYLDTEGATEDATEELALRWRGMREEALSRGAPKAALERLDAVVDGAQKKGDGLVAFTAGDSLEIRRFLSRPIGDSITIGEVPSVLPLLEWLQDNPRYAVVLCDRQGAEIHVLTGHRVEESAEVVGDDDPIAKAKPGGWSQKRFQNRAENTWEANAKSVAAELARIAASEDLGFVVIAGDVRAVQFLTENIPDQLDCVAHELATEPHRLEDIREELDKLAAAWVGQTIEGTLQRFQEERGQNDLAVEGKGATFEALRKAQVGSLLITPGRVDDTAYLSDGDLTQIALDRRGLAEIGIGDIREGNAADVAVRAAFGTGARIVVIPAHGAGHGPREGIGALLRYSTRGGRVEDREPKDREEDSGAASTDEDAEKAKKDEKVDEQSEQSMDGSDAPSW